MASSTLFSLGTHGGLVAGSGITAGRVNEVKSQGWVRLVRGLCGRDRTARSRSGDLLIGRNFVGISLEHF
jgi:hypothetical protein